MNLGVLTYNIHKGFSSNRDFVLHGMRDQLRTLEVDVALLQEVVGHHSGHRAAINDWPETSQFEFLADQVWPHHAYGKNAIADDRHHGNAILSKYPFSGWDNINVSPFQWASRSILHGNIFIPEANRKLHIINLHLGLLSAERLRQLQRLNQHLETIIGEHDAVILGGDFNDWTGRQVSRVLAPHFGLREAYYECHGKFARTFPARFPLLSVDRIYYAGLELDSCTTLDKHAWSRLSDHIPLLARFSL